MAVGAHPGFAATNLFHTIEEHWYYRMFGQLGLLFSQPADMGALPTLRALADSEVNGGDYFGPGGFQEYRGYPKRVGCAAKARDPESIERLWAISEQLTGVEYEWPNGTGM